MRRAHSSICLSLIVVWRSDDNLYGASPCSGSGRSVSRSKQISPSLSGGHGGPLIILYYAILCYVIVHYIILYYIISYQIIVCYIMMLTPNHIFPLR